MASFPASTLVRRPSFGLESVVSGVSAAHSGPPRSSSEDLLTKAEARLLELEGTLQVAEHAPQMQEQIQLLQESIEDINEQIKLETAVAATSGSGSANLKALHEERALNAAHIAGLQNTLQNARTADGRTLDTIRQQLALQLRKVERYRRLVQMSSSSADAPSRSEAGSSHAHAQPTTASAAVPQQSRASPVAAAPVQQALSVTGSSARPGKPPPLSPRRRVGGVPSSSSSSGGSSTSDSSTSDSDATDLEGAEGTPVPRRTHTGPPSSSPRGGAGGNTTAFAPPLHHHTSGHAVRSNFGTSSAPPPPLDPPVPSFLHHQNAPARRQAQHPHAQHSQQPFAHGSGAQGGIPPQLWTGGSRGGQLAAPVASRSPPVPSSQGREGGGKRARQQQSDSVEHFGGSYRFWLDGASSMRHTVAGTSAVTELQVDDEPRIMRALGGVPQRSRGGSRRHSSGNASSASDGGGRERRRSSGAGAAMTPAFAVAVTKGGGLAVFAAATPGGSTDMSQGNLTVVAAATQALHMPRRMVDPGDARSGGNPCLTSDMAVLPPWHKGSFGSTGQLTAAISFTYSARPVGGGKGGAWVAANPGARVPAEHNPTQLVLLRAGQGGGGGGASRLAGGGTTPDWFAVGGNDSTAVVEARVPMMRNVGGAGSAGWGGAARGYGLASSHHGLAPITCVAMAGGGSHAPGKVLMVTGDSDKRLVVWHNVESLWGGGGGYDGGDGNDPHSRRSRRRFSSPQRSVQGGAPGDRQPASVVSTWMNDPATTPKGSLHTAGVTTVGSLSGGAHVASGGMDGRVMLWDLETASSPWSVNLARGKDATALQAYVPAAGGGVPSTWPVLETPIQTGAPPAARAKSGTAEAHNTVRVTSLVGHPRHRDWMLATVLPRVTTRYFLLDARTGSPVMALHAPRMGMETHSELVAPQWMCDPQLWGGEPRAACLDHQFVVGSTDGHMHLFDLRAAHSAVYSPAVQSYGPVYSPCVARGNASKRVISTPVLALREGGGRSSDFTAWVGTAGNNRRVGLHAVSYVGGGQRGGQPPPAQAGGGSVVRQRSHSRGRTSSGRSHGRQ